MSIYISGSLAYDRVMNFQGSFSDYILPDKIHMLNVCFPIGHMEEKRGGTAGNIAYNLAMLGEKAMILASVGRDFASYKSYLLSLGLSLDGINFVDSEFTASAYITTDTNANQITGFHAAAMSVPCGYTFQNFDTKHDIGIISPTNPFDMVSHAQYYKDNGMRYIFDPGQQITSLTGEELKTCINGAFILASNDYELELISTLTGLSLKDILKTTPFVITTLGEKGCKISGKDGSIIDLPAASIAKLEDPTGAGDAFRAGLLKGIINGLDLADSARLGTICAAFCVEQYGTQAHYFNYEDFSKRYELTFKTKLPLSFDSLVKRNS